jgi:hypothetical protein
MWRDEVEFSTLKVDPAKHWSLIKRLSGKITCSPLNQPIKFKGKIFTKAPAIASNFCKLFTFSTCHKSDPQAQKVNRALKAKHKLDQSYSPFTEADTRSAIWASKNSSAVGPDGFTAVHLKHIGPCAIRYLTKLYNLSVVNADIPAIWKAAVIVPVLKPGKSANEGASYRPILLLSLAAKVLEHLLLPDVVAALPKNKSQHGFAPLHSCTMALLPIVTKIAVGFNAPKPA